MDSVSSAHKNLRLGYYQALARILESLLELDRVGRVVEVGCGSGTLSIWFARRLGPRGSVTALDIDPGSLRQAVGDARLMGVSNVRFERGDVYELSLPVESADVVVCKSLLCVLKDPKAAVEAMARVVRPAGHLVAIEPASPQAFYDPDDTRFTYLSERLHGSFHRGWRRQGADPTIGLKVPHLFLSHGFRDVAAEAVSAIHLLSDHRRDFEEAVDQLETEAFDLPEATKALLAKGGLAKKELQELHRRARVRVERVRSAPSSASRSAYVRLMSTLIVTVGRRS